MHVQSSHMKIKVFLCQALVAALLLQIPGFEFYDAAAADFSRSERGGHALTGSNFAPHSQASEPTMHEDVEPLPDLGIDVASADLEIEPAVRVESFKTPGEGKLEDFFAAERRLNGQPPADAKRGSEQGLTTPEGSRLEDSARRMSPLAIQAQNAFGERDEKADASPSQAPTTSDAPLLLLPAPRAPPAATSAEPSQVAVDSKVSAKPSLIQRFRTLAHNFITGVRAFRRDLVATFSYVTGFKYVETGDAKKPYRIKFVGPHSLVLATAILGFLTTYYVSDILEFIILPALTPQVPLPTHLLGIALVPALLGSSTALFGAGSLLRRWSQGAAKPLPKGADWKTKAQAILERLGFDFSKKTQKAFSILAINAFIRSIGEKVYSMIQTFLMSSLNLGSTGVGSLRNYTWAAMVANRPIMGAYADRIPMKKGYVISDAISIAFFAGIPAVLLFNHLTVWILFGLSFASSFAGQIASSITQNRMQNAIAGSQDEVRSWGNVAASRWRNYGTFIGIVLGMILVGNPSIANAAAVKTMFELVLGGYVALRVLALGLFAFFVEIPKEEIRAKVKPAAVTAPAALKLEMPSKKTLLGWISDALMIGGFSAAAGAVLLWAGVSFEVFSLGISLIIAWGVGPQLGMVVANKLLKGGIHGSSESKIMAMVRLLAFPPLAIAGLLMGVYFPGFLPQWAYLVAVGAGLIGAYILSEGVESILAYTLIQDTAVVPKEDQGKAAAALMTVTYIGAIVGNVVLGWLLPKNPTLALIWHAQGAIWAMVIGAIVLSGYTAFLFPRMANLRDWIQKVKAHRTAE